MWFNNVLMYRYKLTNEQNLSDVLQANSLKSCPPHARFSYGWVDAFNQGLIKEIAGAQLICLGKEERILPRTVLHYELAKRLQSQSSSETHRPKKTKKQQMIADLEFELLPKSFCIQKRWFGLLDTINHYLFINTTSVNQANQLVSLLKKSTAIEINPIIPAKDLTSIFNQWITKPDLLTDNFELAANCVLFSLENEKKQVNCKGYDPLTPEVKALLTQGLMPAEISLIWKQRIQFTLTSSLALKKLKSLDDLEEDMQEVQSLDEASQEADAMLVLVSGELRNLVDELLALLIP